MTPATVSHRRPESTALAATPERDDPGGRLALRNHDTASDYGLAVAVECRNGVVTATTGPA